jgi:hypothetical protein
MLLKPVHKSLCVLYEAVLPYSIINVTMNTTYRWFAGQLVTAQRNKETKNRKNKTTNQQTNKQMSKQPTKQTNKQTNNKQIIAQTNEQTDKQSNYKTN